MTAYTEPNTKNTNERYTALQTEIIRSYAVYGNETEIVYDSQIGTVYTAVYYKTVYDRYTLHIL